jgi:hypothetical protein
MTKHLGQRRNSTSSNVLRRESLLFEGVAVHCQFLTLSSLSVQLLRKSAQVTSKFGLHAHLIVLSGASFALADLSSRSELPLYMTIDDNNERLLVSLFVVEEEGQAKGAISAFHRQRPTVRSVMATWSFAFTALQTLASRVCIFASMLAGGTPDAEKRCAERVPRGAGGGNLGR